jgi:hypothetical protein
MRKLVLTSLIVVAAVLGTATVALADQPATPAPSSCLTLPKLDFNLMLPKLPSVCDIKAGVVSLAANLGVSVNLALGKLVAFAAGLKVTLDVALGFLLSLPAWLAKLLCL